MKSSRKNEIFSSIIKVVDSNISLSNGREAKIVSLTFEQTCEFLEKEFEELIRKNYVKRKKRTKKVKDQSKTRLDSID